MKHGKMVWIAALAAAVFGCPPMTAFASSKDKITSIRLEVTDIMRPGGALGEDEELSIETKSDGCTVRDWEIENDGYTWQRSDTPMVKVTVVTENDYYFSVTRDKVTVRGDQASVHSVKKEAPQEVTVLLNLQPMYERVGVVDDAWLDGTVAVWTEAVGAEHYDLYLFRDGHAVGSKKTVTGTTYDFGTAMRKDGEYYYKVRPMGGEGDKEGRFTESESLYISPDDVAENTAAKNSGKSGSESGKEKKMLNNSAQTPEQWTQDEKGWHYKNVDGTLTANGWVLIDGERYYFDADGCMVTGWINQDNYWYYLGLEGELWTNCLTPDGYIVDEDGARVW